MAIPESQLATWSHQGSVTQSKGTYATIRRAIESDRAQYTSRDFEPFLQGSYGNDTNIYAESDVDIVTRLDATFYYSLDDLTPEDKARFESTYSAGATYTHAQFKAHVIAALEAAFPRAVTSGNKAIKIAANGDRRSADVVAAAQFRRYYSFPSSTGASYAEGICFFLPDGTRVVNYPRQHSANCTTKHQATNGWFKPTVRILKNIRRAMVDQGLIAKTIAPSYFLEGLLYNVPNDKFGNSYEDTIVSAINWIRQADRTQFVCANEQFILFGDWPETWPVAHYGRFMDAFVDYWNGWS
jgi:hypothetical protein